MSLVLVSVSVLFSPIKFIILSKVQVVVYPPFGKELPIGLTVCSLYCFSRFGF